MKGKTVSVIMLTLLFFSMFIVGVDAVPIAKLYVDIPCWIIWPGRELVANVNITEVEDLHGFEFKLGWNTEYLDLAGIEVYAPTEWGPNYVVLKNETMENYNATHGRYWLNVTASAPAPSFNGSMILAKLTFAMPSDLFFGPESKSLPLYDTKLIDPEASPIFHEGDNGYFYYSGAEIPHYPGPLIVNPSLYEATTADETFTVGINLDYCNPSDWLGCWKAKLGYNTTLLDVVQVEEGPFIGIFRPANKRFFTADIHEAEGYVNMTGGIIGPCTTPCGGGKLVKVTFQVTYATTQPTIATCVLDLYDTYLTDNEGNPVWSPMDEDGLYQAPSLPPPEVGGIYIPTNKLSLLAPYIGLTILLTVAVATVVYVKKRKRNH